MTDASIDRYQLIVRKLSAEEGGGFFAEAIDIPGCGLDGATPEEAVVRCREALAMALASYAGRGLPLPAPNDYSDESYSGRFVLRVPRSLHRRLSLRAKAEGVSLNHLCSNLLAETISSGAEEETPTSKVTGTEKDPDVDARKPSAAGNPRKRRNPSRANELA